MNKVIFESINSNFYRLANKKITLGFDAFIDIIYKVIRSKDESSVSFFKSIQEFGNYILEKGEKNFSLEIETITTKIGGNMPIMANALAQFGSKQNCIGALGHPSVDPLFNKMPPNCELYSFANPGLSIAMEFNGNKIMFPEIGLLNRIEWDAIKEIVGLETMINLFSQPDMVCLLNWSELDNSTALWKGLMKDILPRVPATQQKPIGFFDLADCSKRTAKNILEALGLLQSFSKYWNIVLSMNMNEALIVHSALTETQDQEINVEELGASLYEKLQVSNVVIHFSKQALAWDSSGSHRAESFSVPNPVLSTGAGDNFNAGYSAGLLMGLEIQTSLILGHATSSFYMTHGRSPSSAEILKSLFDKLDTNNVTINS